ncbi:MAG: hypothetical protein IJV06_06805 [Bacteroidaceae bacterium]|nr:hypothetical protein [Bacteroidaceae bacterium]
MKKFLLAIVALVASLAAEAKVIKITLADGTEKVYASSELSAIDFNDDGSLTVTTWDGQVLAALGADFAELEIGDEAVVTEVFPDTLSFNIDADGIPVDLHSERPIMKMNYMYPSVDPFGEPVTLSGTILIPEEIWNGTASSEGILMVNHYTKFHRDEAPTISNGELENMLLANPLKPNYIIVESDFYGFGSTVRFPQAFMQGLVNARSSLDGLLEAKKLLDDMSFSYGPLCFNIGYSSGGFDALAAQKLRDMEYADRISFDKTFSGGGPSDVCEAYRQYVLIDSTAYNAVPLLLMVCTKETQRLDVEYKDFFQPYISGRIDELILSKSYSSWPVCDSIGREKKVHEILAEKYCDLESPESKAIQELLRGFSLNNDDWTPDLSQRIYLFHSRGDDYVPIQCARPMVPFLASKGFVPSIIPGQTNFQTNFVVPNMGHLSATLIYFIQTLAAIKAWPLMYVDNQLKPEYQWLLNHDQITLVDVFRYLDGIGIDSKALIARLREQIAAAGHSGQIDFVTLYGFLDKALQKVNLSMNALVEMLYDSGIDYMPIMIELMDYLNEGIEEPVSEAAPRLEKAAYEPQTPVELYQQQLNSWLKAGGIQLSR